MSSTVQQTTFPDAHLNKPPTLPNFNLFNKKKSKTLRIASININGNYYKQVPKILDIVKEQKIDIMCIQDIGLQEKGRSNNHYALRNYETIIQTPQDNKSEGLAIIYNKTIFSKDPISTLNRGARAIHLQLQIADTDYNLYNVYITPQKDAIRTAQPSISRS